MALHYLIPERPSGILLVSAGVLWFLYLVALGVYRLYLHPLAKFPGPKLAALTFNYEFYYNAIKKGSFIFATQELHKKYGRELQGLMHPLVVN